jgi:4-amino-4-deoxy-L-arabinose transferase-like glycosyltransferase
MKMTARLAVGVVIGFMVVAGLYARETPFFEAPDEAAHLLYVHHLLESGELPTLDESREAVFASGATHRHHPPLYYLLGAALVSLTERDDLDAYRTVNPQGALGVVQPHNQHVFLHPVAGPGGDTATAIWLLRGLSIVLGAGTIAMTYRIGWIVSGRALVGVLSAALVASIPTFVFISASINNDNLVTFLYTAGIYWLVSRWHQARMTGRDALLVGLILAGAALTKVNGLSLFGVIGAGVMLGAWRGRWTWRAALRTGGIALGVTAILAGWWYLRNFNLYGDPLAVDAAAQIWGRSDTPTWAEAEGVWLSFWMVLGQFNIRGPAWVFTQASAVTALGALGVVFLLRERTQRWLTVFLLAVVGLVMASLVVATISVNISQGRLLYPMIAAFAVLVVGGITRLLGPLPAAVLILPLMLATITTPFVVLRPAYERLATRADLPAEFQPLTATAGPFTLAGYRIEPDRVQPGARVSVAVAFRVEEQAGGDYALALALLDPVTGAVRGTVTFYPGMAATSTIPPGTTLYTADVTFDLDAAAMIPPRQMQIEFKWVAIQPVSYADGGAEIVETLRWMDTAGNDLGSSLLAPAATLYTADYQPAVLPETVEVVFGDRLVLQGLSLSAETVAPGETVELTFVWDALQPMSRDWTLTVQLLADDQTVITQTDGPVPGYPTRAWLVGRPFEQTRRLTLPADAEPGLYRVVIGWYDGDDRLAVAGGENNLWVLRDEFRLR